MLKELQLTTPQVGMGATLFFPDDRKPFVITHITPKSITIEELVVVSTATGHEPDTTTSAYGVWTHEYTDAERETMRTGRTRIARIRKDGHYWSGYSRILVGKAVYHRDFSN